MWRHIAGVKKPAAESAVAVECKEKTRKKRYFSNKWRIDDNGKTREWLAYLPGEQSMHCTYCRTYTSPENANNSFVRGTTNLKLEAIRDHESSKSHIKCTAIQLAKTEPQEQSVAIKTICSMQSAQLDRMRILFRNVHAIGKKGRPFRDYVWMCK